MALHEMLAARQDENSDRIYGVVVGIVKDIKDPLNQGRIRVNFPWRAESTEYHSGGASTENDNVDSTWTRMATMMAGKDRGSWFIPDVGDEVLVAFHHGDPERPYIMGGLWNQSQPPPESMDGDGKNNLRTIKSRSGHLLTFNDNKDEKKEKITLRSQSGHEMILDDEAGKEKISVQTKQQHKIILNDSAGQEKIEIVDKTGSNQVIIDSVQNSISIKSTMRLSIESQIIEIKAGGMMKLEASGVLTIKGAMVMIN